MVIDRKAVFYIVDSATRFSAATFLDSHGASYGKSLKDVWFALLLVGVLRRLSIPLDFEPTKNLCSRL